MPEDRVSRSPPMMSPSCPTSWCGSMPMSRRLADGLFELPPRGPDPDEPAVDRCERGGLAAVGWDIAKPMLSCTIQILQVSQAASR
jgi:hypothetical protein